MFINKEDIAEGFFASKSLISYGNWCIIVCPMTTKPDVVFPFTLNRIPRQNGEDDLGLESKFKPNAVWTQVYSGLTILRSVNEDISKAKYNNKDSNASSTISSR